MKNEKRTMKKFVISLVISLPYWSMMIAQDQPSLISKQVEYSLHEKIKNPYFNEIVQYMQSHPGQFPDLTHLIPASSSQCRHRQE
jgi:hypothetical protein